MQQMRQALAPSTRSGIETHCRSTYKKNAHHYHAWYPGGDLGGDLEPPLWGETSLLLVLPAGLFSIASHPITAACTALRFCCCRCAKLGLTAVAGGSATADRSGEVPAALSGDDPAALIGRHDDTAAELIALVAGAGPLSAASLSLTTTTAISDDEQLPIIPSPSPSRPSASAHLVDPSPSMRYLTFSMAFTAPLNQPCCSCGDLMLLPDAGGDFDRDFGGDIVDFIVRRAFVGGVGGGGGSSFVAAGLDDTLLTRIKPCRHEGGRTIIV